MSQAERKAPEEDSGRANPRWLEDLHRGIHTISNWIHRIQSRLQSWWGSFRSKVQGDRGSEAKGKDTELEPTASALAEALAPGVQTVSEAEPWGTFGRYQPEEDRVLSNTAWVQLVEECVDLFSEVAGLLPRLTESQQEFARHILSRITEILHRRGVTVIDDDTEFDPKRHRTDPPSFDIPTGTPIVKIVQPGFAVGRRVFCKAVVQVNRNPLAEEGTL